MKWLISFVVILFSCSDKDLIIESSKQPSLPFQNGSNFEGNIGITQSYEAVWTKMEQEEAPPALEAKVAVFFNKQFYIWGKAASGPFSYDGSIFDSDTNTWKQISQDGDVPDSDPTGIAVTSGGFLVASETGIFEYSLNEQQWTELGTFSGQVPKMIRCGVNVVVLSSWEDSESGLPINMSIFTREDQNSWTPVSSGVPALSKNAKLVCGADDSVVVFNGDKVDHLKIFYPQSNRWRTSPALPNSNLWILNIHGSEYQEGAVVSKTRMDHSPDLSWWHLDIKANQWKKFDSGQNDWDRAAVFGQSLNRAFSCSRYSGEEQCSFYSGLNYNLSENQTRSSRLQSDEISSRRNFEIFADPSSQRQILWGGCELDQESKCTIFPRNGYLLRAVE